MESGSTRYTQVEGVRPLREAVAADANERDHGARPVDATDVVVTSTCNPILASA